MTTMMMAGPRTVGLGCFSPVQRLGKWSEASEYDNDRSLHRISISTFFHPEHPKNQPATGPAHTYSKHGHFQTVLGLFHVSNGL